MPTGYTYELTKNDVPFETFVLTCAKAFLGRMKETSGPIPASFTPSDYYSKDILRHQAELAALKAMPDEQAEAEAIKDFEEAIQARGRYVQEIGALRDRLRSMLTQVACWQPPSEEYEGLQRFMIEQLGDTLDKDGEVLGDPPVRKVGKAWRSEKIAYLEEEISYDEKKQREEIQAVERDNLWVKQLLDSLKTPHVSTKR